MTHAETAPAALTGSGSVSAAGVVGNDAVDVRGGVDRLRVSLGGRRETNALTVRTSPEQWTNGLYPIWASDTGAHAGTDTEEREHARHRHRNRRRRPHPISSSG